MSKLSKVSLTIVGFIVAVSFVLSYTNIQQLALENGIGKFQSYLFPFLIDAAMLVFAVAVLARTMQDGDSKRAWGLSILIGLYASLSIVFNVWHSNFTPAGILIAVTIPATLFFTFETAMTQIKRHVQAHGNSLTVELAALQTEFRSVQGERDSLQDSASQLAEENAELQDSASQLTEEMAELQGVIKEVKSELLGVQGERDSLQDKDARLTEANAKLKDAAKEMKSQARELKRELSQLSVGEMVPSTVGEFGKDILLSISGELTGAEVAQKHSVSESKVSRIKSAMNGGVK